MVPRFATVIVVLALGLAGVPRVMAAAELKIGITQFPSTLNPYIDSMLAKSYVLAMIQRPITAYDQNWQLVCLLCTELPTLENGLAKRETLAEGKQGIAVTYRLQPEARWGDGVPVTSADMVFSWEVGRHPKTGVSDFEAFRRILSVEVIDDKTFVFHFTKAYPYMVKDVKETRIIPKHVLARSRSRTGRASRIGTRSRRS